MQGLAVTIYVVEKQTPVRYAYRRWTNIPRVGDTVELQRGGEWELAYVTHVRWGSDSADRVDEQRVVLFVKWK